MTDLPTHAQSAAALGVSFDGIYYHFRQYRYERLDDAMRYARAQYSRPGYQPDSSFVPQWLPAWEPDATQREAMRVLDIGFDNGRFNVGPYRYENLADAIAFARQARSSSTRNAGPAAPGQGGESGHCMDGPKGASTPGTTCLRAE